MLERLPPDCMEIIMGNLSSDLRRFAAVSKESRRLAGAPTVWRRAYQRRFHTEPDLEEEWGRGACPPALWKGCLLRDALREPPVAEEAEEAH